MRGRCAVINRRHAGRMETESRNLFASDLRQLFVISRPGATSSSVRPFPTVVVAVIFWTNARIARLLAVTTKFNIVVVWEVSSRLF